MTHGGQMRYSEFSKDDKHRMVKARLKQYEAKHYEATLNREAAVAAGREDVTEFETQIADFEKAIEATRTTLAKLPEPPKTDDTPPKRTVPKTRKTRAATRRH